MKNLLIYTREDGQFSTEAKVLAKIQIDNSLDLGWKREDILLYTNFEYGYNGVKSHIIPNLSYKPDRTNKIPVVVYLLENNLLPNEMIWYHDFDAYQDGDIDFKLVTDIGFTQYGYKPQINAGSFFFYPSAIDKFKLWNKSITPRNRADEKALTDLINNKILTDFDIVDIGYNYGQRLYEFTKYDNVNRKVLHFHPHYKYYRAKDTNIDIFMYGKNRTGKPLMSERLIKIFNKHGIN